MSQIPQDIKELADIIAAFDASTTKLKSSHDALQGRIKELSGELTVKNRELSETLSQVNALKNYLANILESITDGVIAINLERRVVALNRTAAQTIPGLGRDKEGKFILDVLPENCRVLGNLLLKSLSEGELVTNAEVEFFSSSGGNTILSVSVSPILNENNDLLGAVQTFRDLTGIRELERRAARNERLAALGEMSAGVAHEIRNPLGGIELYASNLLRRVEKGSKESELATKIIDASSRLNKIVTDMLTFTRGREPVKKSSSIGQVITSAIDLASAEIERKNISVIRDFDSSIGRALLDPDQVNRAFLNVILNAIQAMDEGGTLTVSARRKNTSGGESVTISFADNGCGIPEEARDKLFNPFFTLRKDGTGLGLAIVHKIILDHGGTIKVSNNEPKGTNFTFTLKGNP